MATSLANFDFLNSSSPNPFTNQQQAATANQNQISTASSPAPQYASNGYTGSNIIPTGVGPQESLLDKLFSGSVTGQGGGPIANMLFSLGQGILPKPMQDMITGTTNDQFGKLGARFGTDLATAISRGLGQAGSTQALSAINEILGLGGTTTGFEFQRSTDAMNRAFQEFMQNNGQDTTMQLISMLLGGGLG